MNAPLHDLRARFKAGLIDKHAYNNGIHDLHRVVFEYADFLRGTEISEIQIRESQVVLVTRDGVQFLWDPVDRCLPAQQALNFGAYEPSDYQIIESLLGPDARVFDVGANVGWYALRVAKRLSDAQVFAFEPLPATFSQLEENLALNALANVRLFNFGLSDTNGDLPFYYDPGISGAASAANILESATATATTCRVRRLDDVQQELRTSVDFIKCDVEGAELFVFRGAMDSIRRFHPVIFAEMLRKWSAKFAYHPNAIVDLLAAEGYACYAVIGCRLALLPRMADDTKATNFVFLHTRQHHDLIERLACPLD